MTTTDKKSITVETTVSAPVEKAWQVWNHPLHIIQWSTATPEWHTPTAYNDLREGGRFLTRMEARDGSFGFDFGGTYTTVKAHEKIAYVMDDGREVSVVFTAEGGKTRITETFDPESENPGDMQRSGWQAILDSFKAHINYTNSYEPVYQEIDISAPREKVWNTMLTKQTYDKWAGAAWPGSTFEGEWKEGSTVNFIDQEQSGTKVRLLLHREHQVSLAEHIAMLVNGKEDTESDDAQKWTGSREAYHFEEKNGITRLSTLTCITSEWKDMMTGDWPKALNKLKELCEQ